MPQTNALLKTLKSCLKAEGKTYADVAKALELSEPSVKRLFSEESFSLARLDQVCAMLGIEISDLVQHMRESQQRIERLTVKQEQEITQDLELLLVTVCIFNHWTIQQIVDFYILNEAECVSKLLKLERLKIIELLPNNRVKLLISPNFKWLENGPIQRFFQEKVGREYFQTSFQKEVERLIVLNGMLSKASATEFHRKLERLGNEFLELCQNDRSADFEEKQGVTMVLAMRNWEYGLFSHMMRNPSTA